MIGPNDPPRQRIPFNPGDPLPGRDVDRLITVEVRPATAEQLRAAFESILAKVDSFGEEGNLARDGLFESARPEHVDRLAKLAGHPNFVDGRIFEALADIDTAQSRATLRRLYDDQADLNHRRDIVYALTRNPHPENIEFLASLMPGRSTALDDAIRSNAWRGLACIGGPAAEAAIAAGIRDWLDLDERVRVLQSVRSPLAVDAIVASEMPADLARFYGACQSLMSLTHYRWCDDDLIASVFTWPPDENLVRPVVTRIQSQWRSWWKTNRGKIRIYTEDEPNQNPTPPKIW
jgi:hypothetical protein